MVDQVEDHLTIDNEVRGQNYCCLSFIEPSNLDLLAKKEAFISTKFLENFVAKYEIGLVNRIKKNMEQESATKVEEVFDDEDESKEEEVVEEVYDANLDISLPNIEKSYSEYKITNYTKLLREFEDLNVENEEVTVRGLKVRGSYRTLKEAQERASSLQNEDKVHHVFVGQVGYWVPFNPVDIDEVKAEYMNEKLDEMVKGKVESEEKRKLAFEDRKGKLQLNK